MENEIITKHKLFWAWQDEKEEAWLREMANQGWHLEELGVPTVYRFKKGVPRDVIYRLDFQTSAQKDRQSYLQLFSDAGWEHVGTISGWQYFRKEYKEGEPCEIYNDAESKVQKYQRLMALLVVFFPIWLVIFNRGIFRLPDPIGFVINIIWFLIMVLYIITMLKLIKRVSQLKKRP